MKQYNDWRDDILLAGITLHEADTRFACPECPQHGCSDEKKGEK